MTTQVDLLPKPESPRWVRTLLAIAGTLAVLLAMVTLYKVCVTGAWALSWGTGAILLIGGLAAVFMAPEALNAIQEVRTRRAANPAASPNTNIRTRITTWVRDNHRTAAGIAFGIGLTIAAALAYWKGFSLSNLTGLSLGLAWYWWVLIVLVVAIAILAWRDSDRLVEWAGSEAVYNGGMLLSLASAILLIILALCGLAHFFVDLPFNAWDYGKWVTLALMVGVMIVTVAQSIERGDGWNPIVGAAIICSLLVGSYFVGNGLYGWWQAPETTVVASAPTTASPSTKDGKRVASTGDRKGAKTTTQASPAPRSTPNASASPAAPPAPATSPAPTATAAPASPATTTSPAPPPSAQPGHPTGGTTLVVQEFKPLPAPARTLKRQAAGLPIMVGNTTYDRASLTTLESEVQELAKRLGERARVTVNTEQEIKIHSRFDLVAYVTHLERAKALFSALDHSDVTVVGSTLRGWQLAQKDGQPPYMGHTRFSTTVRYSVPLSGALPATTTTVASAATNLGFAAQTPTLS